MNKVSKKFYKTLKIVIENFDVGINKEFAAIHFIRGLIYISLYYIFCVKMITVFRHDYLIVAIAIVKLLHTFIKIGYFKIHLTVMKIWKNFF